MSVYSVYYNPINLFKTPKLQFFSLFVKYEKSAFVGGPIEKSEDAVKSEHSEESGYFSAKQDDEGINLSVPPHINHQLIPLKQSLCPPQYQ